MSPDWERDRAARSVDMALIGRDEELDYLRRVRQERPLLGVVVAGPQGIGKTRLVAEAVAQARSERWAIEQVDGAAAAAKVPFSAMAHLAPAEAIVSGDPLALMVALQDLIARRVARKRTVLVVDDGHLLDEASLALVRRLASLPNLFLLVTVRSDEPVPAPIVGLWKDGLAHRLELQPLSREETYRLATEALGVVPEALRRLWDHSLGNPLFLRELALAEQSGDRVPPVGSGVSGPAHGARRLAELVQSRLGGLSRDQRRALEILTVTGPLGSGALIRLVPESDLDELVDRRLVGMREEEPEPIAMLGHPVYGVVIAEDLPASRASALRAEVLDQLGRMQAEQTLAPRDAVRLTTLRLDLGVEVGSSELLAAVRYVHAAYPRAVGERLAVGSPQIDGATAAVAAGDLGALPSRNELEVAERLAREAWESDGRLAAGLALTTILVARKNLAEATQLIESLEAQAGDEWERTQVALAKGALAYWVLDDAGRAEQILLAAEEQTQEPAALARLGRLRAGIALNVGRVEESVELARSLLPDEDRAAKPDVDVEAVLAAATAAAGLALQGQAAESMELGAHYLPAAQAHSTDAPELLGQLLLARVFAARVLGRFDEAEWFAYACYEPAVQNGSVVGMAIFTGALGQIALDKGQPVSAIRRLREAEVLLRECDTFGYRPYVLASLAAGLAQLGDSEGAADASEMAASGLGQPRYFDSEIVLGAAWAKAADGRMSEAAGTALRAADQAGAAGLVPFEAGALHAAVRFGEPSLAAPRLGDLAERTGSPLIEALAAHAIALAAGNADRLVEASAMFQALGANLLAVEAAGQAAAEHHRGGRRMEANQALARMDALADRIEGARSPSLRLAARPPTLTAREHEVAVMAAEGLTSKQIAERLVVSPRTVESHLYRAFAKLGVSDRGELPDLLVH